MLVMEIKLPAIASVAAFALAASCGDAAAAPESVETVSATSPASVVAALAAQGYEAALGQDGSGDPLVTARIGGWRTQIVFMTATR
jgi:hypothetical protein